MTTAKDPLRESLVDDYLARARTAVTPRLQAAAAALPPAIGQVVSYHFGWADAAGRDAAIPGSWGKGLRPALVLASAEAVGGDPIDALPAAAAVEMVHQASLVHDDLIDTDSTRRHRPAVWTAFNPTTAILAGDALFFASIEALHSGSPLHAVGATTTLTTAVQRLIDGERADVEFESRPNVTVAECLEMSAAKTAALIECACSLGARFGGADDSRIGALAHYGHHLGLAFQAMDDLLGIWGRSESTGKPVLADLRRRKRSLPVVFTLNAGTAESAALQALYRKPMPLSDDDIERAAELLANAGARDWVQDFGRRQIEAALAHLERANPSAHGAEMLTTLASFAADRDA